MNENKNRETVNQREVTVLDNLRFENEWGHRSQMQVRQLYPLIGVTGTKLPLDEIWPKKIGNTWVKVLSQNQIREAGRTQRVIAKCADCGEWIAFGKLQQHRKVHVEKEGV